MVTLVDRVIVRVEFIELDVPVKNAQFLALQANDVMKRDPSLLPVHDADLVIFALDMPEHSAIRFAIPFITEPMLERITVDTERDVNQQISRFRSEPFEALNGIGRDAVFEEPHP